MKPHWRFIACLAAGLAAAGGGWGLIKSQELKKGETAYVSFFSPRWLLYYFGWMLALASLFLLFIFSPMCYMMG